MRALAVHETVMQLMINTLSKTQQQTAAEDHSPRRSSISSVNEAQGGGSNTATATPSKDTAADMVVSCCRFLCYFCRTSRHNQRAMFEHLSYLLENSCMLLCKYSLCKETYF